MFRTIQKHQYHSKSRRHKACECGGWKGGGRRGKAKFKVFCGARGGPDGIRIFFPNSIDCFFMLIGTIYVFGFLDVSLVLWRRSVRMSVWG